MNAKQPSTLPQAGWRPMPSAPRDGSMILVCTLAPGRERGLVLPACYMRPYGDATIEGFWGVWPTSQVPIHLMKDFPHTEGFAVDWRLLAITPLSWKPLPAAEDVRKLRRRKGKVLGRTN